jgi:peptidoglycan/LPS O-acetylase OafA/YrhL
VPQTLSPGSRQPDLEALRAIAALMVFASHLPWYQYFPHGIIAGVPAWLSPAAPLFGIGGFAVVLFLVLSGMGLCRTLVLKEPPVLRFLRERVRKLFSTYWAIALPILVVSFAIGWLPLTQSWNALLLLLGLGWVSQSSWAAIFPSWWYMAIAWQAVAVVPLMVWGLRKVRPVGVLFVTALVVLGSCYLIPALGMDYGEKSLIIARALEVLGGVFLAFELWPEVRERAGVSRRGAALLVAGTFACLVALLAFGYGGRWLYRAAGLALVAAVVYGRAIQRTGARALARASVYAGSLSFVFYLLHEPTMLVVRRVTSAPTRISMAALAALCIVAVSAVAVLFSTGNAKVRAALSRRGPSPKGETS